MNKENDLHEYISVTRLRQLIIIASASFFGVCAQGFIDNLPFTEDFHWVAVYYGILGVVSFYVLWRSLLPFRPKKEM